MGIILAGLFALGLGMFLEDGLMIWLMFAGVGVVAGLTARTQPPGAEKIYWLFVLVIIALAVMAFFGIHASRFAFILPIVFVASYFLARLVQKFAGSRRRPG